MKIYLKNKKKVQTLQKQTVLVRTVKKMKDVKVKKIATPKTSLKSVTKAKKPLDKSNKATVNEKVCIARN